MALTSPSAFTAEVGEPYQHILELQWTPTLCFSQGDFLVWKSTYVLSSTGSRLVSALATTIGTQRVSMPLESLLPLQGLQHNHRSDRPQHCIPFYSAPSGHADPLCSCPEVGAVEMPRHYPAQEGIIVWWEESETFKLQQDQSTRRGSWPHGHRGT